jgi:hypothetical protein
MGNKVKKTAKTAAPPETEEERIWREKSENVRQQI